MSYTNSKLVEFTRLSPNCNPRKGKITKITIHHMAGNYSIEAVGNAFAATSRQASSNYGIGTDGRIAMYVEEKNRSWARSNAANDHAAITIEVANDGGANWHVSDKALSSLIRLCVDICQRNGIKELVYTGDPTGNLTRHNMFVATSCPGEYLQSKFPYIVEQVNKELGTTTTITNKELISVEQAAKEVIQGKYGNGQERKQAITALGLDYEEVQARVNDLLSGEKAKPTKTVEQLAKEVILGLWGNGQERKNALISSGYDYELIQKRVNELLR
jgi:hypothetical protein